MMTVGIVATIVIALLILFFAIGTKKGVEELDESPKPPEFDDSRRDVRPPH